MNNGHCKCNETVVDFVVQMFLHQTRHYPTPNKSANNILSDTKKKTFHLLVNRSTYESISMRYLLDNF